MDVIGIVRDHEIRNKSLKLFTYTSTPLSKYKETHSTNQLSLNFTRAQNLLDRLSLENEAPYKKLSPPHFFRFIFAPNNHLLSIYISPVHIHPIRNEIAIRKNDKDPFQRSLSVPKSFRLLKFATSLHLFILSRMQR